MTSLREKIVAYALWGANHEPDIHYSQGSERFDAIMEPEKLPLRTDCSAFVTLCYGWAGAPDPNGLHYNGYGFTGTLLSNLPEIDIHEAQPGDLIVYGPGSGDHVVMIVSDIGPDPVVVSHGQERGPIRVRHSVEVRSHRAPVRVLRGIGEENMASSDEILAKLNEVGLYAANASNQSKSAVDKADHVERMLGSLITALKEKGVIES